MKVNIKQAPSWIGPYQLADMLKHVGVSEDTCDKIGKYLADKTPLTEICTWIHDKRKHKVKVKIEYHDTWSADRTLSHIIVPLLEAVIAEKCGTPINLGNVEGMPEEILIPTDWGYTHEDPVDPNASARWEWIMNEMLWAMKETRDESPNEPALYDYADDAACKRWHADEAFRNERMAEVKVYYDRVERGHTLFGKHFRSLWT